MDGDWRRLGDAVRARRRAAGLSQLQLAERADVSESTIKNIEKGRAPTRMPPSLAAVAQSLGWTEDSIDLVLAGADPVMVDRPPTSTPATNPDDEDAFVKELRVWPGLSQQLRDRLIAAYVQNKRERLEAAAAAAERLVRPLAEAAARGDREEPDLADYPESTAS